MTQLIFKKADGTVIDNVSDYVNDFVREYPYSEVYIGCDSQEHSKHVKYSVVIVMHEIDESGIGHGAHVISADVFDKRKNVRTDIYSKLWAEAEYTVAAARMIDGCEKDIQIHLDYNNKEGEYSNTLYSSGIGYAKGMGYKAVGKPHSWASSHVADDLCKSGKRK